MTLSIWSDSLSESLWQETPKHIHFSKNEKGDWIAESLSSEESQERVLKKEAGMIAIVGMGSHIEDTQAAIVRALNLHNISGAHIIVVSDKEPRWGNPLEDIIREEMKKESHIIKLVARDLSDTLVYIVWDKKNEYPKDTHKKHNFKNSDTYKHKVKNVKKFIPRKK